MIIDHTHKDYVKKWNALSEGGRNNGAYYYSKEIVENIIPRVRTDRNWITVNLRSAGCDHAIVFVHNNLHPEHYKWLTKYEDIILVCGIESTVDKVSRFGRAIYLPLSIDVDYVSQFKTEDKQGTAFAGRPQKRREATLPSGITILEGLDRETLLRRMATFEKVYAVGRCAIEAKCLGCEIGIYDPRFPEDCWQVVDNKDAAAILQEKLDEIDGINRPSMEWLKADLIKYAEDHGVETDKRDTKAKILERLETYVRRP